MSVYSDTLKMNEHWGKYILSTGSYKYNWCEGAYRSGKSVMNTLAFALYLEKCEDKIHLVIASTVASARAIVEDGDGKLGLKQYFGNKYRQSKYKGNDCGIIRTPSGEKIVVYLGGSMESSYKIFRGWSCGGIVLEELNILHENTINEAKGRILMAKDPKVFISHNPVNSTHPIYKWLEELQTKNMVNYDHSTLTENPALTEDRKNEIISEFDPNSLFYKQYILGERVDAQGLIFTIRDYNIFDELDINDYSVYVTVADPGKTKSSTAFSLVAYNTKNHSIDVLREYTWKNNTTYGVAQKHSLDLAKEFVEFNKECIQKMGYYPTVVFLDSFIGDDFYDYTLSEASNQGLSLNLKFPLKSDGKTGKDEDSTRISRASTLLYQGKLRFYKDCKGAIHDFRNLQYDQKEAEKGRIKVLELFTESGHNDFWDCVSYAISYLKNFTI